MWGIGNSLDMVSVVARARAGSKHSPLISSFILAFLISLPLPAQADLNANQLATLRAAYSNVNSPSATLALSQVRQLGNPAAAAMIQWLYLQRPDNSASFEDYATFLASYPDWPRRQILANRAEEVLQGDEDASLVASFFKANPPTSVSGLNAYVLALRQTGQAEAANTAISTFWRTATLEPSEQRDVLSRYRGQISGADIQARIDRIMTGGYGASDLPQRRALLSGIPQSEGSRAANDVRLKIIQEIRSTPRGQVSATQRARMEQLVKTVPAAARQDSGFIYDYARWLDYADQPEKAAQLLNDHPEHPHGDPAYLFRVRDSIARDLIEKGQGQLAYQVASAHGLTADTDQTYRDAEWMAGWIALRFVGNPEKAWTHFQQQYNSSTALISRARGAYWLGRTAAASGKPDVAQQWYKVAANTSATTFYGQIAALQLSSQVHIEPPVADTPSTSDRTAFNNKPLVQAALLAHQLGADDLVKSFMLAQANTAKTQAEATLTLKLADRIGNHAIATFAAKRLGAQGFAIGREGYPVLRMRVPQQPESALIHAIIRQESTFDAQARSPAGALGLMQLMPATARRQASKMGIRRHTDAMLQDNPGHNVQLGSAYLQGLLDDFDGSYILAAAGYNAGPNRAKEWVGRFGSPTQPSLPFTSTSGQEPALWRTLDWIEMIPFAETRNYVMRVNEAVSVYRAVLVGKPAPLALARNLSR